MRKLSWFYYNIKYFALHPPAFPLSCGLRLGKRSPPEGAKPWTSALWTMSIRDSVHNILYLIFNTYFAIIKITQ